MNNIYIFAWMDDWQMSARLAKLSSAYSYDLMFCENGLQLPDSKAQSVLIIDLDSVEENQIKEVDHLIDHNSVFMIGYNFYGDMEISANTGWIGSGFANFRIYGVIIYSVILGSILAYFSALGDRIGQKFVFGATFVVVITLFSSTDLTTALLTHGLLALLFIMLFFRENAMSGNV